MNILKKVTDSYTGSCCQTSMMDFVVKIVNGSKSVTILTKNTPSSRFLTGSLIHLWVNCILLLSSISDMHNTEMN